MSRRSSRRGAHHGTLTTHVLPFSTPNPHSKEAHESARPPNIAHLRFAHAEAPPISNHQECSILHSIALLQSGQCIQCTQFGILLSLSIHSSYLIALCLHAQPATTAIKCRCCSVARQRADDPIHPKDLSDDQWHADRRPMTTTRCMSWTS